jgi:hypothetical protein
MMVLRFAATARERRVGGLTACGFTAAPWHNLIRASITKPLGETHAFAYPFRVILCTFNAQPRLFFVQLFLTKWSVLDHSLNKKVTP